MKKIAFAVSLLLCGIAFGQDEIKPKIESGIYSRTNLGVLVGKEISGSFQTSMGYRFTGGWELGLALGFEDRSIRNAPLMLDMRKSFQLKKSSSIQPFVAIQAGAILGSQNAYYYYPYEKQQGYTGGISIGVTNYYTKHLGMTLSLGYRFSQVSGYIYYPYLLYADYLYYPEQIRDLHRFEVRFGISLR
jgi:hypothetical protein